MDFHSQPVYLVLNRCFVDVVRKDMNAGVVVTISGL